MKHLLLAKRNRFNQSVQQLDDYSPLKTLNRGYTYTIDENKETVSSIKQIKAQDKLELHFKDGIAETIVTAVRGEGNGNKEE